MSDGQAWAPPESGAPHDGRSGAYRSGYTGAHRGVRQDAHRDEEAAAAYGPPPGGWLGTDRAELLGGDIPLRPLGVAEILDGAIVNIRHNPRGVLGLSLAITTVVQVLQSLITYFLIGDYARDEITPVPIMRSLGAQLTVSLLGLLMSAYAVLLLAGMLGPAVGRTLFGLPAAPGQVWRDARPGLPRLAGVATIFMGFFALRIPFVVAEFVFFGTELSGGEVFLQLILDTAGRIVSWTLTIPFDAGVIALLYVDRRMRREGFDLELQTRDEAAARPADFLDLWRPAPAGAAHPAPRGWPG